MSSVSRRVASGRDWVGTVQLSGLKRHSVVYEKVSCYNIDWIDFRVIESGLKRFYARGSGRHFIERQVDMLAQYNIDNNPSSRCHPAPRISLTPISICCVQLAAAAGNEPFPHSAFHYTVSSIFCEKYAIAISVRY